MKPWVVVYRKELSDYATSKRFLLLFAILVVLVVAGVASTTLVPGAGLSWVSAV